MPGKSKILFSGKLFYRSPIINAKEIWFQNDLTTIAYSIIKVAFKGLYKGAEHLFFSISLLLGRQTSKWSLWDLVFHENNSNWRTRKGATQGNLSV